VSRAVTDTQLTCPGFIFAGVSAGIKAKGGRDIAMLVCDEPATTAAVFTQNRLAAAPVRLSQKHLSASRGRASAIVINSGNANACTGKAGMNDALSMAKHTAYVLSRDIADVLVCSTGVIGNPLPIDKVNRGILHAAAELRETGFGDFANAILTTDKRAKIARQVVKIAGKQVTLMGCTKGAGMIMPNMATTLTFVVTDAAVTASALQRITAQACAQTFNAIAVDGDTSTNDTLTVTASGISGARILSAASAPGRAFTAALTALLADLATQLMCDGEGVHHVVDIVVRGAKDAKQAAVVARRIAISPLVKTAIAGSDPNWGRILCAVGNAGVQIDPTRVSVAIAGIATVAKGQRVAKWNERAAVKAMKQPRYAIDVTIGRGRGESRYLACDLSHEYVSINADYRS
jgi:glutamate N-acetyltransferase / amino-acid N-acetyltransferase